MTYYLLCVNFIFHVKVKFFVTESMTRIRIQISLVWLPVEVKSWIWVRVRIRNTVIMIIMIIGQCVADNRKHSICTVS
jgi:hypothetical protein